MLECRVGTATKEYASKLGIGMDFAYEGWHSAAIDQVYKTDKLALLAVIAYSTSLPSWTSTCVDTGIARRQLRILEVFAQSSLDFSRGVRTISELGPSF